MTRLDRHPRRAASTIAIGVLGLLLAVAPATIALPARPTSAGAPTTDALAIGQVQFKLLASGLSSPLGIVHAGDGSGRLFIVQRGGTVRVFQNGALGGTFMNISSKIVSGSERGLLGLAFHPNFESNRMLFAFYTRPGGDIVISRFLADVGLASVDEGSEVILLVIEHSEFSNHNGGQLAFGPDGYLYAAVGDGGDGGDPHENGQNKNVLLGKILRIDVNSSGEGPNNAYGNPATNPFKGATAGADEIWDYGLRNPWRFSFDRETDALWIADVGQSKWEEINREPGDSPGGVNYGWDVLEGTQCYNASSCNTTGKTFPIAQYSHDFGCSITGGYVYRGTTQLDLVGHYVLADFCSGRVWTIPAEGSALAYHRTVALRISSFGESEGGELYAVDLTGGRLYRVVAPEYGDILSSAFIDDIHWVTYEGLASGCGGTSFCPRAAVSRAQMASFLARALDLPNATQDYFADDETSVHEVDINRIAEAGITTGCASGLYCPTLSVSRAEMATFLVRALDLPSTTTDYFTDDEGSVHEPNINALAASGISGGCGGSSFCPTDVVTREQMAAFLHRAFD